LTIPSEPCFATAHMNAMERLRGRLALLLDDRTPAGKIRQKRLADYMGKSEAWLSNVLSGKRGLRIVDLDKLSEFFHIPPSELVREGNGELVEVTPTELRLLRRLRGIERTDPELRDGILKIAGIRTIPSSKPPRRRERRHGQGPPKSDT
jgi:transcriptional regulator with XRE-family HTH domain